LEDAAVAFFDVAQCEAKLRRWMSRVNCWRNYVRRAAVKHKRQKRGPKCRPLAARKTGADQSYKEFKLVVLYDERN
jgi:hypothetical protein